VFAQCPTCRTVYQVSAADLNVTRGRLHCDFCDTTFDALGSLTDHPVAYAAPESGEATHAEPAPADDLKPTEESQDAGATDAETAPEATEESAAPPEPTMPPAEESGAAEPIGQGTTPDETASAQIAAGTIAAVDVPEILIEPGLSSHDVDVPGETPDEPPTVDATAPDSAQHEVDGTAPNGADTSAALTAAADTAVGGDTSSPAAPQAQPEGEPAPDALDPETLLGIRRSPWARAAWSLVAVLMLLLLAAQVVHRSRSELIMQPSIAPWMYRIYGALGVQLDPNWDVERYRIVRRAQMSAVTSADSATQLQLVATLTNDAARPQPYPILRLTLEDRWGSAVGAREFTPREYLREADRAARLLAPGEEAEIELLVVDPGVDAAGFRLDMCLADAGGVIRCADDDS